MLDRVKSKVVGAKRSLTIWFNSFMLSVYPAVDFLHDILPQVRSYVDDEVFKKAMLFVIVAGNIALRFKTSKDLAEK